MSQYHHFAYDDVNITDDDQLIFTYTSEEEDDDGDLDTRVGVAVIPMGNITAFMAHPPDDACTITVLLENGHWFLLSTDNENSNVHYYAVNKLTEGVM